MSPNNQQAVNTGLPPELKIERALTQKNVNRVVLQSLLKIFNRNAVFTSLDLPCGNMEFVSYLHQLFPDARLSAADIEVKDTPDYLNFKQMDLTRDFPLPDKETYDLITSISGIMVFDNTLGFLRNCISRLKTGGTIIITNDNPATATDRLAYLFLARYRIYKPIFEEEDTLIQIVPIQELCRILKMHGIEIEKIKYTSFYLKDLMYLPVAILIYPFQLLYLMRLKSATPQNLKLMMYPFSSLFCKHYVMIGKKKPR